MPRKTTAAATRKGIVAAAEADGAGDGYEGLEVVLVVLIYTL